VDLKDVFRCEVQRNKSTADESRAPAFTIVHQLTVYVAPDLQHRLPSNIRMSYETRQREVIGQCKEMLLGNVNQSKDS